LISPAAYSSAVASVVSHYRQKNRLNATVPEVVASANGGPHDRPTSFCRGRLRKASIGQDLIQMHIENSMKKENLGTKA